MSATAQRHRCTRALGSTAARGRVSVAAPRVEETHDIELLERWRGGDRDQGNALVRRHFALVSRFFRRRVSEGHADLIQRTFLGCVESRDRVPADLPFRVYLLGIARRVLFDHLRAVGRRAQQEDDAPLLESQGSPSRVLDDARQQRLLFRALRRLPIELQLTLELHYWEQLKVEEVARVLEIPGGTVKSRLARARTLLREAIGACEADPELRRTTSQGMDAWLASMRRRREG